VPCADWRSDIESNPSTADKDEEEGRCEDASPKGFYGLRHIFLLVSFMALMRVKTNEQLRYHAPGEWGVLMGLDRIPEVRTLREKLKHLASKGEVSTWSAGLSKQWMEADPEAAGVLYVDGHVRVYHGSQTKLPRRYVARERLCLRGMTDYWVNDQEGRPFFAIGTPFTEGLLAMLREEMVPRLLKDVPNQPEEDALRTDDRLARFTLVFDREGYSPVFFRDMWETHRIACLSYRKNVKADGTKCVVNPAYREVEAKIRDDRLPSRNGAGRYRSGALGPR
jgi:prepilin-type processing-associated H-X9-DG protein